MKKLFNVVLFSSFLAIVFFSCNKDDSVSPGGGNPSTGPVTATFSSNPGLNKVISNSGPVLDTINANITDNILSNNISDVKITLGNVENVEVDKIKFSLVHGGTEVAVIDVLTKTGVGNFTNTVLWDSATTPIDQGQTPYTGTFIPQNPLSGFNNADPAGNWIIKIAYTGSVKSGVIKSWGITITYNKVTPPALQIFPTAIGNIWILAGRDSLGNYHPNDTMSIPYTITWQNKILYRLLQNDKPNDTMYFNNESDGAYMYGYDINYIFTSRLFVKYPVSVGQMFIGGGDGPDTVYCTSVSETVITPSGTHTGCIKYDEYRYGQLRTVFYMKPGVGLIRIEHYQNNILFDPDDLYYYHLNK